jgi:hypothetical protein
MYINMSISYTCSFGIKNRSVIWVNISARISSFDILSLFLSNLVSREHRNCYPTMASTKYFQLKSVKSNERRQVLEHEFGPRDERRP